MKVVYKILVLPLLLTGISSNAFSEEKVRWDKVVGKNSEIMEQPDYLTQLTDGFRVINKDRYSNAMLVREDVLKKIYVHGLLGDTEEEQKQITEELNEHIKKYFSKILGTDVNRIQGLILDTEKINGEIYLPEYHEASGWWDKISPWRRDRREMLNENSKVVILLGRGLVEHLKSLDAYMGVVGHELVHYLKRTHESEQVFDQVVKQMSEEDLADIRSALNLLQQGLNPLGMSHVLDLLLRMRDESNYQSTTPGLVQHSILEARLSKLNALIEKWMDRYSIPPLQPMPPIITKFFKNQKTLLPAQKLLRDVQKENRLNWSESYPFLMHIKNLGSYLDEKKIHQYYAIGKKDRFFRKKNRTVLKAIGKSDVGVNRYRPDLFHGYFEDILPFLRQDVDYLKRQITPASVRKLAKIHGCDVNEVIEQIETSFDKAYIPFTTTDRKKYLGAYYILTPRIVTLNASQYQPFLDVFTELDEHLSAVAKGVGTVFRSRDSKVLRAIETLSQSRSFEEAMGDLNRTLGIPVNEWIENGPSIFSLVSMNPLPYSLNKEPHLKNLYQMLVHAVPLVELAILELNRNNWNEHALKKARLYTEFLHDAFNALESSPDAPFYFNRLRDLVNKLNITPAQRFMFFGDYEQVLFKRDESQHIYYSFHGITRAGQSFDKPLEFFETFSKPSPDFKTFHREMIQLHGFFKGKLFKNLSDLPTWIRAKLGLYKLDFDDIKTILLEDLYWHEMVKNKEKMSSMVVRVESLNEIIEEGLDWVIDTDLGGLGKDTKKFQKAKHETEERYKKALLQPVKNTFYNRDEYQSVSSEGIETQVILYAILKEKNELPQDLEKEFELWKIFALRAVSPFTDEWAEKIFQAALKKGKEGFSVIEKMYRSQLVWDLRLRHELAQKVYSPQNNTLTQKGLENLGKDRRLLFYKLALELKNYFPEQSQEKYQLYDHLAHELLTTKAETLFFRSLLDVEDAFMDGDFSSLKISEGQAVGTRILGQLFDELQVATLEERMELLDFLLGNQDYIPKLFGSSPPLDFVRRYLDQRPWIRKKLEKYLDMRIRTDDRAQMTKAYQFMAIHGVSAVLGPYRTRRFFQSLDTTLRAVLIDPLLMGKSGILGSKQGRDWIIQALLPSQPSWTSLAVDLVDGYVKGLEELGQSHLKTLFLSYLLSSSVKNSQGKYHSVLYDDSASVTNEPLSEEEFTGQMLRRLFEANPALTKIGQRVHGSYLLKPRVNEPLAGLKDQAARATREQYFQWLEDAARCDEICQKIMLTDVKGSASVKVVIGGKISGEDAVIHLIRPNAKRRGDSSFALIEYAVKYALEKGHTRLKLMLPLVQRARKSFQREVDLIEERKSQAFMANLYQPGKNYGKQFQFITPEAMMSFDSLVQQEKAQAVRPFKVKHFKELSPEEKTNAAEAIMEKEKELKIEKKNESDVRRFDKDRHEGNFLFITDPEVCAKFGVPVGHLILVIDPGQMSSIESELHESVLRGFALVSMAGYQNEKKDELFKKIESWLFFEIMEPSLREKVQFTEAMGRDLQEALAEALAEKQSPLAILSKLLAHADALGLTVQDGVWDFVTALSTDQTWNTYLSKNKFQISALANPLNQALTTEILQRVQCENALLQRSQAAQ